MFLKPRLEKFADCEMMNLEFNVLIFQERTSSKLDRKEGKKIILYRRYYFTALIWHWMMLSQTSPLLNGEKKYSFKMSLN